MPCNIMSWKRHTHELSMNRKVCEVRTVRVHREKKKMVCVCAFPRCEKKMRCCWFCFPKMAPACFREGTGFLNFIFNKLSVHLQSSQCFVLHVGTLIMLPWKCGAILSLVSGIELRFNLHDRLPPQLAL